MIARKEVWPVEVVRVHLERIAALDATLRAYITVCDEAALAAARAAESALAAGRPVGALHGVPVALKDLYDTAGVRTTGGSKILADRVPEADATVVRRLKEAGAIVLGKLHMVEFAYGPEGLNAHRRRLGAAAARDGRLRSGRRLDERAARARLSRGAQRRREGPARGAAALVLPRVGDAGGPRGRRDRGEGAGEGRGDPRRGRAARRRARGSRLVRRGGVRGARVSHGLAEVAAHRLRSRGPQAPAARRLHHGRALRPRPAGARARAQRGRRGVGATRRAAGARHAADRAAARRAADDARRRAERGARRADPPDAAVQLLGSPRLRGAVRIQHGRAADRHAARGTAVRRGDRAARGGRVPAPHGLAHPTPCASVTGREERG